MASITEVARQFFEACEAGKGWAACAAFCTPDATFSAQAEPLLETHTLHQYCDWMTGIVTVLPDSRYDLKSLATDEQRRNVCTYAVFHGTHTGPGGPVPPTGKSVST